MEFRKALFIMDDGIVDSLLTHIKFISLDAYSQLQGSYWCLTSLHQETYEPKFLQVLIQAFFLHLLGKFKSLESRKLFCLSLNLLHK
jgi:hypothetical protein